MIQVFSKEWFYIHQQRLLWLANTLWGRALLGIDGKKSSVGNRRILRIDPNAITWRNEDRTFSTEFRTNDKSGRILYHRLKYVWKAFHYFDQVVANPLVPQLNLGFDTLTAYPDSGTGSTTVDGRVNQTSASSGVTWASLRDDTGNIAVATDSASNVIRLVAGDTSGWSILERSIYTIDTSSLGSDAKIISATFSVYGNTKTDTISLTPDVNLYSSSPSSDNDLIGSDYSSIGTTEFSTAITYANWTQNVFNDFSMNASGLAEISKTGITRLGIRNASYDAANSEPGSGAGSGLLYNVRGYYADQTGTTIDPKLVVNYGSSIKDPIGFGPIPFPR